MAIVPGPGGVLNPWTSLPPLGSASYVLPADNIYVRCFNRSAASHHSIITDQIPEPWLGPAQTATLFVLQLNPRYLPGQPLASGKHRFIGSVTAAHYGIISKAGWWLACFGILAQDIGKRLLPGRPSPHQLNAGYAHIAPQVCSVEYFPYGSDKFGHSLLRLPSQEFSFDLVRNGIARGACIVVLKGWKEWLGAVPELCCYSRVAKASGFRGAKHITDNTCPPGFYHSHVIPAVFP